MFGKGRPAMSSGYFGDFRRKASHTRDFKQFLEKLKRMPASLCNAFHVRRSHALQRGYVYFQDFMADNPFDTRITIIGGRAFGFRRFNRPGDFRASGSGEPAYETEQIDPRCVRIAFDVAKRLGSAALAFDFLFDENHEPKIGEVSYTFVAHAVYDCPGYWDEGLNWREGHHWPQDIILEDFLNRIASAGQALP
jgi:hypothetical protein